ncbi:MAG: hypothetical protein ACYDA6_00815 [Solirubrobacteraceae bacterium]
MSLRDRLRSHDDTSPWQGAYAPYDLVKELCIAVGVIALLTVLLTVLFSSPDDRPSTISQWARQQPVNFITAAAKELDGTSPTAEYGPPYNHNGEGQHAAFIHLQKWLGVSHPINTAFDYVIGPLKTIPGDAALAGALAEYQAAPKATRMAWGAAYAKPLEEYETAQAEHRTPPANAVTLSPAGAAVSVRTSGAGPVPILMTSLLGLARSGGLDGALLTSNQFFQTDYTKPLLFMSDGGLLAERAESQHLLGSQWGMMNETGSYPGQVWLWLYTLWYQVEPIKSSHNADILVMILMSLLSLAFVCVPLIPGVRSLPRLIPIHRLIWREHYRSTESA